MVDLSNASLLVKAKNQLGLRANASNSRVPDSYIEELRSHLKLYPLEDNFRVTLQPKNGFGTIICLKHGCRQVVHLDRRVKCEDGGKKDGFGSFSAFWTHLSSHLLLETRVRTRSDKTSLNVSTSSIKAEPHDLPLPSLRASRSLNRSAASSRPKVTKGIQSVSAVAKLEPVEPTIPRKRTSEAFSGINDENMDKSVVSNPPKKVKAEPVPKASFIPVTNVPVASGSSTRESISMNLNPRPELEDRKPVVSMQQPARTVTREISGHEYVHAQVARRNTMNTSFANRMVHDTGPNEATIATSDQPKAVVKREFLEVTRPVRLPSNTSQTQRRISIALRPFPMDLDGADALDAKPLGNPFHSAPLPATSERFGEMASSSMIPPSDNKFRIQAGLDVKPFIPQNAAASSSRHTAKSSMTPYIKGEHDVKPFVNQNAVASSSRTASPHLSPIYNWKVKLPGVFVDISDDDSEDSDVPGAVNPPDLGYIYQQIGINIPVPMDDDAHDDNGDYHGRGRDLFVGPQAAAEDIEKFLLEAGNAETFDGNETVDKALAYLGLQHLDEKLPGMDISLMPHQVMGVAWMIEKEKSGIKGGCLADEMGLGKTVQMIACMVQNRSKNPSCRTNLIVAPLALLNQWKQEIEDKTNYGLTCLVYHGPSRTRSLTELRKYDVVLTTFNTMAHEWPDYENQMQKKAKAKKRNDDFVVDDSDDEDMRSAQYRAEKRKKHAGLLFQMSFHRIVADEGQQIRNRRTRMSRAITDLLAEFRWVLTGTPIVNSLSDVYGYIRFLKIRPWYDWAKFHNDVGKLEKKQAQVAVARLQKIMVTFLLRRKKDSQLDGKKLIELPTKEVVLRRLEFSEEEREIYTMVEARSQAKFNRYLRAGTVLKNYHQVLVLLLRLRQICSHPSLIQEDGVAFVRPDEAHVKPEFATELTRARRLVSSEFVDKMVTKFKQQALTRMQAEKQPANATVEEDDCPICYDAMTEAVVTPCTHIFCRDCIVDVLNRAPPMDPNDQAPGAGVDERACPVCRSAICLDKLFSREAFTTPDDESNNAGSEDDDAMDTSDDYVQSKDKGVAKKSKKIRRRSHDKSDDDYDSQEEDDGSDISDFIVESDEDEEEKDARRDIKKRQVKHNKHIIMDSDDEPDTLEEQEVIFGLKKKVPVSTEVIPIMSRFLPSSKMKFMMDQLKKLQQSKPEEKTLIVSQWTGCLSLVSDYLTENSIPHVKYQGDMNRAKRDQAVQVFMSKEKARIMLMSLKCGGVGLNLTRANNVISLDLGWSQAVEAQAYDRVHRLGQTRKVIVERIVIADTVEDRILALQERKQALADGSLGEGTGQKIGKLSVKELANLFGLDARGRTLKLT